jgi:hypothetical protein
MRSGPSGKLVDSRASVEGARIAAPTPCNARLMVSQPADCARPVASEAAGATQTDGAVTDDGHRLSRANFGSDGRVMARPHHV